VVVHPPGGQRRELQERRVRIQQLLHPLARQQLPPRAEALHGARAAPLHHTSLPLLELAHQIQHPFAIRGGHSPSCSRASRGEATAPPRSSTRRAAFSTSCPLEVAISPSRR